MPLLQQSRMITVQRATDCSMNSLIRTLLTAVRTSGRSIEDAGAAAEAANVPVSTIAFGTDTGVVDIRGQLQKVPVDRLSLQQLAENTKGYFYEAASVSELKQVYEDMGSSIGHRVEPREVTQWYAGLALLLGLAAAGLSLIWTSRLP